MPTISYESSMPVEFAPDTLAVDLPTPTPTNQGPPQPIAGMMPMLGGGFGNGLMGEQSIGELGPGDMPMSGGLGRLGEPEDATTTTGPASASITIEGIDESQLVSYVTTWRNQLRMGRRDKLSIWNECWQLYRGLEDWSDKEEWQTKIVIPKAWASVKQATNVIKRLLSTSKEPWSLESVNPEDLSTTIRAEQQTDLTKQFLDMANFVEVFGEGLECGFIIGVGVWKIWWGLLPRTITQVQQNPTLTPDGRQQLLKQIVRKEILEGHLHVRAVDPYNFYWLPGSKLNAWTGTIEDVEVSKWELIRMANAGMFPEDLLDRVQPMKIDEYTKQSMMRFSERPQTTNGPSVDTGTVKLTEFYGPIVQDGKILAEHGHVIIANDSVVLKAGNNPFWHQKAPYVGFSPLALPFRTEGVGLIEMVRAVDRALSKLANLSVDTLLFRLLPVFEITPEIYENPEDFETGLTPGKIFRRNLQHLGQPGLTPIAFEDVSGGAIQVQAGLDRAHQEGALVSEIQQGLPMYRGAQTATEVDTKAANQATFFGNMAIDIENQAIKPIVEMSMELICQFIDTSSDPRVASILGIGAQYLQGLTRAELQELVIGDYKVKVSGLTQQLQKAEVLQNLVQFMNLIGQNPQAWLPYINQDKLLQRILECFRPAIHDIENIIADPETVAAAKAAMTQESLTPDLVKLIPQLLQLQAQQQQQQQQPQPQPQPQQAGPSGLPAGSPEDMMMSQEAASQNLQQRQTDTAMKKVELMDRMAEAQRAQELHDAQLAQMRRPQPAAKVVRKS